MLLKLTKAANINLKYTHLFDPVKIDSNRLLILLIDVNML